MEKNMNALDKLKSALAAEQLAKTVLMSDHSQMIGQKVRITKKYAQWLENNLDDIHTSPGAMDPEETKAYIFSKANIKKRFTGKVISSKFDREDGITLKVEFKEKINGNKITYTTLLGVDDLEYPKK